MLVGLLCSLAHQSLKRTPWVGYYSAVQCISRLRGQSLCYSAADAGMWAERGYGDVSTPYALSSCFHGCTTFLQRHSSSQSLPSHPLSPSLCSPQQLSPWDCSTVSKLQFPAVVFPGDLHPCPGYVWLWQGLFDSHLSCHRSSV